MGFDTPSGFRDVLVAEALEREKATQLVNGLLTENGYAPVETPTLEYMAAMQVGGRMPETPFKFFDSKGSLVTLRPDVTLQIARMCASRVDAGEYPLRLRYTQRVFRETQGDLRADVRERTQIGIECIGEAGISADVEVVRLFIESLQAIGVKRFTVSVATVGVLNALIAGSGATPSWQAELLSAFHSSDFVEIDRLTAEGAYGFADPGFVGAIAALSRVRGSREAIAQARAIAAPLGCADGLDDLETLYTSLEACGLADSVCIDFSVMSSFDYYTGIVFEAFAPGQGVALGSGGRYDNMLGAYGTSYPAAGFAFYLDEALDAARKANDGQRPLRIAVPKGSLNPDTISVLERAGLDVEGLKDPGRTLIIRDGDVEYLIVRPSDAPVFVEMGAADCGICGEDSLIEADADVVELVDLGFGSCRFIVAKPQDSEESLESLFKRTGSIRVATKYPRIAQRHFAQSKRHVEIVQLRGNIELGPITGMSDCIVDITATGTTLRENGLVVVAEVLDSTARFFANVSSYRTDERVRALARALV